MEDEEPSVYEKKRALRLEKERKLAEYKAQRKQEKKAATLARRQKVLAYQRERRMRDQADAYKAEKERQERLKKENEDRAKKGRHCSCGRLREEGKRNCNWCEREQRHELFEFMQPSERQINSARCRVIRKGHEQS